MKHLPETNKAICVFAFIYAASAFIAMDANPANWPEIGRAAAVCAACWLTLMLAFITRKTES